MWPIFTVIWLIHIGHKALQALAYLHQRLPHRGRSGSARYGPLFTVIEACFLFSETFSSTRWQGAAPVARPLRSVERHATMTP